MRPVSRAGITQGVIGVIVKAGTRALDGGRRRAGSTVAVL